MGYHTRNHMDCWILNNETHLSNASRWRYEQIMDKQKLGKWDEFLMVRIKWRTMKTFSSYVEELIRYGPISQRGINKDVFYFMLWMIPLVQASPILEFDIISNQAFHILYRLKSEGNWNMWHPIHTKNKDWWNSLNEPIT